jgi:2'-5' RNA ligase
MRLFIGIPLAAAVVEELSSVASRLRRNDDGLRWTAAESWHITLQFLGETDVEQCKCLAAGLGELHSAPVAVRLGTLGFFDRAGVFIAEVEVTPRLLSLQQSVAAAASRCGFVAESRTFHPHITLARMKNRSQGSGVRDQAGMSGLKERVERQPAFTRFVARQFNLYESFLGPGGSRYEVRERYPLTGDAL